MLDTDKYTVLWYFVKPGHGRNASCPAPPAQIRTCATNAYGSYIESKGKSMILPLSLVNPVQVVIIPSSVSWAYSRQMTFSLPNPFAPPSPPSDFVWTLFEGFFTTMGLSDFQCIIFTGYVYRLPIKLLNLKQPEQQHIGSPEFRIKDIATCIRSTTAKSW